VSVVLAARDAEATISEAVQSVLAQSVRELELVVVDDGSKDGTGRELEAVAGPEVTDSLAAGHFSQVYDPILAGSGQSSHGGVSRSAAFLRFS